MKTILKVDNITKKYGEKTVLNNISFKVGEKTIYTLLGPNGAGKTTLLSIIVGIQEPSSGQILINGKPPKDLGVKRIVSYCPQEPAIYDDLTGYENMVFYARLYGLEKNYYTRKIRELLQLFGLEKYGNILVKKYSGGMKKRLSLAIALLPNPKILILDEPTTGMDPNIKREVWKIIKSLREEGKTIILATHDMEEADHLSDIVAIIDRGKIVVEDKPEDLKRKYGPKSVIVIELTNNLEKAYTMLSSNGFTVSKYERENVVRVFSQDPDTEVPKIVTLLYEKHIPITSIRVSKPSLGDVFVKLTGRRLE